MATECPVECTCLHIQNCCRKTVLQFCDTVTEARCPVEDRKGDEEGKQGPDAVGRAALRSVVVFATTGRIPATPPQFAPNRARNSPRPARHLEYATQCKRM